METSVLAEYGNISVAEPSATRTSAKHWLRQTGLSKQD